MSFYTAAVGAGEQQRRLNVQANNIANVNTHGFKAERPAFAALMYGSLGGIDGAALPRGSGARLASAATDFGDGPILDTGGSQDYAIMGDGFFALFEPSTGEVSYTRDGSFSLSQYQLPDAEGVPQPVFLLSDGQGRFVLNQNGSLIEVDDPEAEQAVGVFDFINVDGMLHAGDNRFLPVDKNGQVRVGAGQVRRGALEASNSDLATELGKVIEAQRSFSYVLRMVQTSDEVETTVNGLRA